MEAAERDSTQDWLVPAGAAPPLLGELELKVDEALAIARSSEAAVNVVGEAALDAARSARRAAELAESASAAALEVSRAAVARTSDSVAEPLPPVRNGGAPEEEHLRQFIERADRVFARLRALDRTF